MIGIAVSMVTKGAFVLKLRKVELQGFKSFCDRTELRFNGGGIAAVVGPNGCGKSNLSDAISWVLGEQSARSLRGARMEDVIFAGTKVAQSGGDGFGNDGAGRSAGERVTPGADNRRYWRVEGARDSLGEWTFRCPACRAQSRVKSPSPGVCSDRVKASISLMGGRRGCAISRTFSWAAGLGPESYAIIEQGRIGQILSSKPQDRRAVIEEAAGITKYKSRRRLAEAKLESSKQNLARVFDILEEVTRQVNSLKRQASKAKRYQELKGELEGQLRTDLSGRYVTLKADTERASAALEAASAELKDLTLQATDNDAERQKAQEVFYALEAQLTEARRQLAEMNIEAERTKGGFQAQVREAASIEQRMTRADQETTDLEGRLQTNDTERTALAQSVGELDRAMQEVRNGLLEKNLCARPDSGAGAGSGEDD